jgi:iron complex outermembrane recepter protein
MNLNHSCILLCKRCSLFSIIFLGCCIHPRCVSAQEEGPLVTAQALKSLSIEELMNIEVTLVSRAPVKLTEVASAIQVITRNDILRSGATNIPEALRLASNLQVAQLNANAWIISARGFNTIFANKLLVMIDGRTVYTPLFGGVLWAMQNVLLEDIERIEVVSGPGGTLWGANAVNGVINIITRSTNETQGTYISGLAGDFVNHVAAVRHGGKINENLHYRVYAQNYRRNSTLLPEGGDNSDQWYLSQAGFRMDWQASNKDAVVFQGDAYQGNRKTVPAESPFDGQNAMARWTHTLSETSNFIVQTYFDRYWTNDAPGALADQLQTFDIDFQHQFTLGKQHEILWGIDYRNVNDHVINRTINVGLLPTRKNLDLISGFVQDAISIGEKTKFTVGTKILHNVYSGIEIQPSARLSFSVSPHDFVWAAISRAIRAPSRLDVDYYLPTFPVPPESPSVAGGPDFTSEKLLAYEAGYRLQPGERSTFSIAGFYNVYRDLYSVEALPGTLTYQIQNGSEGESWGGEFTGTYQILDPWRIKLGYTYINKDLRNKPGRDFDPSYLGNDSRNQAVLQSILNLPKGFQLDLTARYLDYLPATLATPEVPEYFTFDARIALQLKYFEFSVVGQNLATEEHVEFGTLSIPRSVYGRITCRF